MAITHCFRLALDFELDSAAETLSLISHCFDSIIYCCCGKVRSRRAAERSTNLFVIRTEGNGGGQAFGQGTIKFRLFSFGMPMPDRWDSPLLSNAKRRRMRAPLLHCCK